MSLILVVDDEPVTLDFTCDVLTSAGYGVCRAGSADDALDLASDADLIVTDLLMPGTDGYQLARMLHEQGATRDTPVVFYSANYNEDQVRPLAEACGVHHLVRRDAGPQALLSAVEDALIRRPGPAIGDSTDFHAQHADVLTTRLAVSIAENQEQQAQFQVIAEIAPVGIMLLDAEQDRRIRYSNPAMRVLFDVSSAREAMTTLVDAAIAAAPATATVRGVLTDPAGTERHVEVQARPVHNASGTHSATVVVVSDITDTVRAHQREREIAAERAAAELYRRNDRIEGLSRMARGVAHEFNNILAGVGGHLNFAIEALEDNDQDPVTLDDLRRSLRGVERAAAISNRLLAFGRHAIGNHRPVDLAAMLRDHETALRDLLPAHVRLDVRLPGGPVTVLTDPDHMLTALRHLIANAGDAMPQPGTCTVILTTSSLETSVDPDSRESTATLDIADTGVGMTREQLERGIEPFYSTKPEAQGTGLGLTEAHGIITRTGGHLTLTSAPGQGTTARIRLPLHETPATQPGTEHLTGRQEPAPIGHTRHDSEDRNAQAKIVVADDEPDIRRLLDRILTRAGFHVLTATDGQEALDLIAPDTTVAALLTDVQMPRMNGYELAAHVTTTWPHIPVVFISGYPAALLENADKLPAHYGFVKKPFTPHEVLQAIRAALPVEVG